MCEIEVSGMLLLGDMPVTNPTVITGTLSANFTSQSKI